MEPIQDAIVVNEGTVSSMVEDSRKASSVLAMKATVDEIKRKVMKKDVHYGIIPGTQKDTLYQEGADVLGLTFKIAFSFETIDLGDGIDEVRYRSKCTATYNGEFLGDCEGEASSFEEKYKWRRAVCAEEWDATPIDRRRLKFYKGGDSVKQVRTEPADIINTVLKMAQKRAKLGCIKTVLAVGDIFAVDLDDIPAEIREEITTPPAPKEPRRKAKPKAQPKAKQEAPPAVSTNPDPDEAAEELAAGEGDLPYTGKVMGVRIIKETDKWTMWAVKINDMEFVTFDEKIHSAAMSAKAFDTEITFEFVDGGEGKSPKLTYLREIR